MKKVLLLTAVFGGALLINSCGGDTNTAQANSQKVGTLTVGVKFPQGGVRSQFIDPSTQCIYVSVYKYDTNTYTTSFETSVVLTPDNSTATIQNIPVGEAHLWVASYDGPADQSGQFCTGNMLEGLWSPATIVEGNNSFTINMIRAKWVFVDQNNNPVSIPLEGTFQGSGESIDGFYVLPWTGLYPMAIDTTQPSGINDYDAIFFGSGLGNCQPLTDATLCRTGYAKYTLQLIGPNTSNNAFETDFSVSLSLGTLQPDANGAPRVFMILGTPPCNPGYYTSYDYTCSYTFNPTTIESWYNTSVTAPDTMEGTIAEVRITSSSETKTCYTDPNNKQGTQVNCPGSINVQSLAIKSAIFKTASASQLVAAQTCVDGASLNQSETWKENTSYTTGILDTNDLDGDGDTFEFLCDNNFDGSYTLADDTDGDGNIECWPIDVDYGMATGTGDGVYYYVDWSGSYTFDVCFHPFTAKAEPIPANELNLVIQSR